MMKVQALTNQRLGFVSDVWMLSFWSHESCQPLIMKDGVHERASHFQCICSVTDFFQPSPNSNAPISSATFTSWKKSVSNAFGLAVQDTSIYNQHTKPVRKPKLKHFKQKQINWCLHLKTSNHLNTIETPACTLNTAQPRRWKHT